VPNNREHGEEQLEDPEAVEITGKATEEAHHAQEVKADQDYDAQEVEAHQDLEAARKSAGDDYDLLDYSEEDEAQDAQEVEAVQDLQPARKSADEDYDLLDYSEEDEALGLGAPSGYECIPGAGQLPTPPESNRDNQPVGMESKEVQDIPIPLDLAVPSRSTMGSPPQAPIPDKAVLYDEDLGDSSWPEFTEDAMDLEDPEEPVRLVHGPLLRGQDLTVAKLYRKPPRPDRDRNRIRSPMRENSSEKERGFRIRTPSPRRSSAKSVLMEDVVENTEPSPAGSE
jgi:hypothetical protein